MAKDKKVVVTKGRKPNSPENINYEVTLKKHINLINCSQSKLSLRESKIYNALLMIAYQNQIMKPSEQGSAPATTLVKGSEITPDWIVIDSTELKAYAGQSQIRKTDLEKSLRNIQKVSIEKVDIRENHGVEVEVLHGASLITEFEMVTNLKTNDLVRARFKLPELIRTAQVNPGIYASLDLPKVNTYRSRYAYHLDPFIRVNFNKHNFAKVIDIDDYRAVVGVPPNAFIGRNDNLFVKAAKLPLDEIKAKFPELRDLECTAIKKGRAIVGIEFSRKRAKQQAKIASNILGYDELLHKFNFSQDQVATMRRKYEDERIYAVLQYSYKMYVNKKNTAGEIQDLKAYSLSCLNKNIDLSKSQLEEENQAEKEIAAIERDRRKCDYEKLLDLQKEHNGLVHQLGFEYFKSLLDSEKEMLIQKLMEKSENQLLAFSWDKENGFNDKHGEFELVCLVIESGYLDKDDTDFANYVFNKTGRRIKNINQNSYMFVEEVEEIIEQIGENFNELLETFLKDYRVEVAKLMLKSKNGAGFRKQVSAGKNYPDEKVIELLSSGDDILSFGLDEITSLHGLTLSHTPELILKKDGTILARGSSVLTELYALLPKELMSVSSLIF